MTKRPRTPELDKLQVAKQDLNYVALNNFVDWLAANGWELTSSDPTNPVPRNFDQLFAQFAQIDMSQVDKEAKALVEWCMRGRERQPQDAPKADQT